MKRKTLIEDNLSQCIFIRHCCLLSLPVLYLYVYFKIKITMTDLTRKVGKGYGVVRPTKYWIKIV